MKYGAIDLHTQHSQIRIVTADGTVIVERRIATRDDQFAPVFGGRERMRILLESSTESEWVAASLEALGHEVVVADPNVAAMYGTRTRRIKTDRRDVAALAEANRTGVYRAAHRVSAEARAIRPPPPPIGTTRGGRISIRPSFAAAAWLSRRSIRAAAMEHLQPATRARKAARPPAALEKVPERPLDKGRQALAVAKLGGLRPKRLEMVATNAGTRRDGASSRVSGTVQNRHRCSRPWQNLPRAPQARLEFLQCSRGQRHPDRPRPPTSRVESARSPPHDPS